MSQPRLTIRKTWWKYTDETQRQLTPCDMGDEAACSVDIEIGGTRITFRKDAEARAHVWHYRVEQIERLMWKAFEQGRSAQRAYTLDVLNGRL